MSKYNLTVIFILYVHMAKTLLFLLYFHARVNFKTDSKLNVHGFFFLPPPFFWAQFWGILVKLDKWWHDHSTVFINHYFILILAITLDLLAAPYIGWSSGKESVSKKLFKIFKSNLIKDICFYLVRTKFSNRL